jgi:hypothetical protein
MGETFNDSNRASEAREKKKLESGPPPEEPLPLPPPKYLYLNNLFNFNPFCITISSLILIRGE